MEIKNRKCSIPDCCGKHFGKGFCQKHYQRYWKTGDPLKCIKPPPRLAINYLNETVLPYLGNDCLLWPFNRNQSGYGTIRCGDTSGIVSRLVCENRHGPPPTPDHHAAHSCGNGHLGCVTGNHLSWKTRLENMADMIAHGRSARGDRHPLAKLSEGQVRMIFAMKGVIPMRKLAKQFNVSRGAIEAIMAGRSWGWINFSEAPR